RPPIMVAPYDAELFGHWWYEGPEFLDYFVRKAWFDQKVFSMITPEDYLRAHHTNQIAKPSASSWGEEGYYRVWLNEKNEWILPHLQVAQERMTELAQSFAQAPDLNLILSPQSKAKSKIKNRTMIKKKKSPPLEARALKQAARELLLAQAS